MRIAIGAACLVPLVLVFAVSARTQGLPSPSGEQTGIEPSNPQGQPVFQFFNTSYVGLIMSDHNISTWSAALQNISGVGFGGFHQLGLGVGLDFYEPVGLVPVFLSYSVEIPEKSVAPFLQVNLGYASGWLRQGQRGLYEELEEGGSFFSTGVGCRVKTGSNVVRFMVGYRRQIARFTLNSTYWWGDSVSVQKRIFNRAILKVGFEI